MDNLEEKISSYIAENILFQEDGYPYPLDSSFFDNSIIDSMHVLELVLFVEENFDLQVSDDDIVPENFDSVVRIADFVRSRQQRQHAGSGIS